MKLPKKIGLYFLETEKYCGYFALIHSEGFLYWNLLGEAEFVRPKDFEKAFGPVELYGDEAPIDWDTKNYE